MLPSEKIINHVFDIIHLKNGDTSKSSVNKNLNWWAQAFFRIIDEIIESSPFF